jgi:hypothetical protein
LLELDFQGLELELELEQELDLQGVGLALEMELDLQGPELELELADPSLPHVSQHSIPPPLAAKEKISPKTSKISFCIIPNKCPKNR